MRVANRVGWRPGPWGVGPWGSAIGEDRSEGGAAHPWRCEAGRRGSGRRRRGVGSGSRAEVESMSGGPSWEHFGPGRPRG